MPRRKQSKYEGDPWPDSWDVRFAWTLPESAGTVRGIRELETRKHDVALKGHPSVWYMFDRYVFNNDNGKEWVDAFALYPHAHWHSFRPDEIVKVRVHIEPKKRKPTQIVTDVKGKV